MYLGFMTGFINITLFYNMGYAKYRILVSNLKKVKKRTG